MENIIILLILLLFFYLLLMGQYISSLLYSIGILGILLFSGTVTLGGLLKTEAFNLVSTYAFTTVPLYILMAQFILQSGIVKDLYNLIFLISKGKKSVLGVMTVFLGGLLGGVSGSATATSAALGQIAVPELQRRGFSDQLAGSIAAASGSLSAIIPPSIFLILYGVVAQISIGKLFIAALVPGILLMIIYSLITIFYLRFDTKNNNIVKKTEGNGNSVPTIQYIFIIIAGFTIVMSIFGGIYTGVFTPTEAGAVGAFLALLISAVLGKINRRFLVTSFIETSKITAMAMFIVLGASLFGKFISISLIPRKIINLLNPIIEYPVLMLIIIMIFYFILFMFIEGSAVILMTVPIMIPILDTIGIDPIWFGIMLTVISAIGLITPPVGISVYAVGGTSGIAIEKLFRTTTLFAIVATILVMGILILFPQTVTWLPSKMN